jgi:5-methylcytosine-specific restriction endonuclease McrA
MTHARVSNLFHQVHKPYKKTKIPKALREQVWLTHVGKVFETKCKVVWCENRINAFDYQCGHNIPESRGGKTNLGNLIPICSRCNISMGSSYSIDQWNSKFAAPPLPPKPKLSWWSRWFVKRS